ncbi:sm-like protein LSM8 isoform X2 [Gossypium arboreum]|uniref:sm-like protein LSM8 isoform X2 n=1 Tax=Gossypium arboreum TaxID=29729 RepID=UPI00081971BA|nr:sm-like protein LSM8 isoform X2 [Gossypium arboreum]
MSTGPGLESLVDQTISVITNDGRNIVGVLKGFDQATNIILDESHERVYSTKKRVCVQHGYANKFKISTYIWRICLGRCSATCVGLVHNKR